MCLDRVEARHKPPVKERLAWKVFRQFGKEIHFPYYGAGSVARGEWHTADRSSTGGGYRAGFHAYKYELGAKAQAGGWKNAVIVRVRLRGIRVTGRQRGQVVYVADEMFVPKLRPRKEAK